MSHPVTVLRTVERVDRIMQILQYETHNGFPVVDNYDPYAPVVRYTFILFLDKSHFCRRVQSLSDLIIIF